MARKKTQPEQEENAVSLSFKLSDISIKPGERNFVENGEQAQERWLDVSFKIIDSEDAVVAERSLAFDPNISKEDLQASLDKFLATFTNDAELAEKNKKVAEENANAIELAKEFEGKVIE
jgi:flagella basal body P-ring formation protein FlgA